MNGSVFCVFFVHTAFVLPNCGVMSSTGSLHVEFYDLLCSSPNRFWESMFVCPFKLYIARKHTLIIDIYVG